jgi:ABC-type polar amino acid transport system ATPase subunit
LEDSGDELTAAADPDLVEDRLEVVLDGTPERAGFG